MDTNIAYQGAARHLGMGLLESLSRVATEGIVPDLTFYLDINLDMMKERLRERGQKNRLDQENEEFYHCAREAFLLLAREKARIKVVDALPPPQAVHQQILSFLQPFLES